MAGLSLAAVAAGAEAVLTAALVGEGFAGALAAFAEAAGAKGAILIGEASDPTAPSGVRMAMQATPSIADHAAAYRTGDIPRDPRIDRVRPRFGGGFLPDFGTFRPEEIERDAYYNEHLAAYGLGWHACAFLADWPGQGLYLNLKRERRRGHYEKDDLVIVDTALPTLRIAAAVAHALLAAEIKGAAGVLAGRHLGVFALDAFGRAKPLNEAATACLNHGLSLAKGRLTASGTPDLRLEQAIARAVARPGAPGVTVLETAELRKLIVRLVPVKAEASDVFAGPVALAIVEVWERLAVTAPPLAPSLREAFGLTAREAQLAALMAEGTSPSAAAKALGVAEGTARNHLKALMGKMAVSRQAELAALLAHLNR